MKQLQYFFLALIISVLPYSCSEDSSLEEEFVSTSSEVRNTKNNNSQPSFYQLDYVADYLSVKPVDDEELKFASDILTKIYQWETKATLEYEITTQYGIPAWSLSRVDLKYGNDYLTVLTPIVNVNTQSNVATIVSKLGYDGALKSVNLYDSKKLHPTLWNAFEPYFNELTDIIEGNGLDINESVFSRDNPCTEDGMNCWCMTTIGECVFLSGGDINKCGRKCSQSVSGGSDGEEEAPDGSDYSSGGSNNSSSSSLYFSNWNWSLVWPPFINPLNTSWVNYGNIFSGSSSTGNPFFFPEDGFESSDVANIDIGIINIDIELYPVQVQGFINHYNLPFTVPQLIGMLPNDPSSCAGLKSNDFYNCARYNLTKSLNDDHDLNLTDLESWYLFNNFDDYGNIFNFISQNGSTPHSRSSVSIYLGLADAGLLDLSYAEAHLPANLAKLKLLINDKLEDFGLEDQASLDPASWYLMFKKEAENIGGDFAASFLEASEKALNEFWNDVVSPLVVKLEPVLQSIGDQFPQTEEEWQALMAIYGPTLALIGLDIGTDFIPVVGELKALYRCGDAIIDGEYGTAALEFIGGIAGIVPIGDLLKGTGKVISASVQVFIAFKALKALAKVSGNLYSKIVNWTKTGWKIIWDDGLKKIVFKNGDEVIGSVDENGIPDIISNIFKSIIDVDAIKNLVPKTLIDGPNVNKITKEFIEANANRFNITNGPLKSDLDDIVLNGDPTGTKTEYLMNELFKDADFTLHDGSYGPIDIFGRGMNGFDGVYIKGSLDNPIEIIINESKQFNANNANYVSLSKGTGTNPAQMTDAWVIKVIDKLRDACKHDVADAIELAKQNMTLTKIVTVIDATPTSNANGLIGGVSIVKVK